MENSQNPTHTSTAKKRKSVSISKVVKGVIEGIEKMCR